MYQKALEFARKAHASQKKKKLLVKNTFLTRLMLLEF